MDGRAAFASHLRDPGAVSNCKDVIEFVMPVERQREVRLATCSGYNTVSRVRVPEGRLMDVHIPVQIQQTAIYNKNEQK